jgi:hypothetical protein
MSGTKQQSNIRNQATIKRQEPSNNQTPGTKQQSNVRNQATMNQKKTNNLMNT